MGHTFMGSVRKWLGLARCERPAEISPPPDNDELGKRLMDATNKHLDASLKIRKAALDQVDGAHLAKQTVDHAVKQLEIGDKLLESAADALKPLSRKHH